MPTCPFCKKFIHTGAIDQCPVCSYRMEQAEHYFGQALVSLSRVVDRAGVFSREERSELVDFLERLERRISPVALAVYITDRGRKDELPIYAHWLLNHLKINHASFGARGYQRAVEDNPVVLNLGGGSFREKGLDFTPLVESTWSRMRHRCKRWYKTVRDLAQTMFDSELRPVEEEWMLILVMDVQSGRACFTWGYKLDSYLDPIDLSLYISSAHSHFREKDVLGGIKKLLSSFVSDFALNAKEKNDKYRQEMNKRDSHKNTMQAALLLPLLCSFALCDLTHAQEPPQVPLRSEELQVPSDLDIDPALDLSRPLSSDAVETEDISDEAVSEVPLPRIFYGTPASEKYFPSRGTQEEKEDVTISRALFASIPAAAPLDKKAGADEEKAASSKKTPTGKGSSKEDAEDELIPTIILDPWQIPSPPIEGASLQDENHLLSDLVYHDVESRLKSCNANQSYHLYLSIVDTTRGELPAFGAGALLPLIATIGEKAMLIQYSIGSPQDLEVAMQGLNLSEVQEQQWSQVLSSASAAYSDNRDALLSLVDIASKLLKEQTPYVLNGSVDDTLYLPKVNVVLDDGTKASGKGGLSHKASATEGIEEQMSFILPYVWLVVSCLLSMLICYILHYWYYRSSILIDMPLDKRLSSSKGAGVSPVVLYKESYSRKRIEREQVQLDLPHMRTFHDEV